jgi:hypothetical protein
MVFNAAFNNILDISWQSVLLVEETKVLGVNHRVTDTLYQIMLYRLSGIRTRSVYDDDHDGT